MTIIQVSSFYQSEVWSAFYYAENRLFLCEERVFCCIISYEKNASSASRNMLVIVAECLV